MKIAETLFFIIIGFIIIFFGFYFRKLAYNIEGSFVSKIRSIPMGKIKIKGKVRQKNHQLKSIVDSSSCAISNYSIGKSGRDKPEILVNGTQERYFFIYDDTGSVLVDTEGSKFQIMYSNKEKSIKFSEIKDELLKENLIKKHGLISKQLNKLFVDELILKNDDEIMIYGYAGDNPFIRDGTGQKNLDDIMIQKQENVDFLITDYKDSMKKTMFKGIGFLLIFVGFLFSLIGLLQLFL